MVHKVHKGGVILDPPLVNAKDLTVVPEGWFYHPQFTRFPVCTQVHTDSHIYLSVRRFCFTLNNYTPAEELHIHAVCEKSVKYIVAREICPTTKTPHLQCYIEFKNAKTYAAVKQLLSPRIHVEKAKGNRESQWDYCVKEDLSPFHNFTDADKPVQPYIQPLPTPWPWQEKILSFLSTEPNDRSILWVWEADGKAGKTTFARHYLTTHSDALILPPKTADMQHLIAAYFERRKRTPRTILLNLTRTTEQYLNYGGIESVKDMCFCSGKYESSMVIGACPHMVIFSNYPPDTHKMSLDRWVIREIVNKDIDAV